MLGYIMFEDFNLLCVYVKRALSLKGQAGVLALREQEHGGEYGTRQPQNPDRM